MSVEFVLWFVYELFVVLLVLNYDVFFLYIEEYLVSSSLDYNEVYYFDV